MKKQTYQEKHYKPLDLDIIIYCASLNIIGGIETWIYYIAKKYNIGQITVLYNNTFEEQKKRLEPYIDLIQYVGQPVKCNKIIFTDAGGCAQELYAGAKERYLTIHCDYDTIGWDIVEIPKMDKIYAVSETATKSMKKIQEQEVFTLYNPVEVDKPRRLLKLISATRLTKEKGLENMLKLADELERKEIPYIWLIFTDRPPEKVNKNIILMQPRYCISDYIAAADYGVQLSYSESYCLFVNECLKLKTPVIITDLDVYKELGITEYEAHILNTDMSNLDVEKIYNEIPKVKYECKNSDEEFKKLLEVEENEKKSTKKTKRNGSTTN